MQNYSKILTPTSVLWRYCEKIEYICLRKFTNFAIGTYQLQNIMHRKIDPVSQ